MKLFEQRGSFGCLIEMFYSDYAPAFDPKPPARAKRLIGRDFDDLEVGESRRMSGTTMLVRIA